MVNPISLANLTPVQPGQVLNPSGRKVLGAYITECKNSLGDKLSKGEIGWNDIREMARSGKGNWRPAAVQMIQSVELPRMADYEPLLDGEMDARGLEKSGVDTTAIKKMKLKRREIPQDNDDPPIVEYEREIELHNRSGEAFDRIMDRTVGKPAQSVTIQSSSAYTIVTMDYSLLTPAQLEALRAIAEAMPSIVPELSQGAE